MIGKSCTAPSPYPLHSTGIVLRIWDLIYFAFLFKGPFLFRV